MSEQVRDLLFELGTEELPPKNLYFLSESLGQLFSQGLKDLGLQFSSYKCYASPRRLTVFVENLAESQPDRVVERKGPAVKAAFDNDGNPTKAALGFAKSCGVEIDQLEQQETEKGAWLVFKNHVRGQATMELVQTVAADALAKLPIAKRMNWGNGRESFVRPVHWITFLFGHEVVPCDLFGKKASNQTYGHRFHAPQAITVHEPREYEILLEKDGHVISDFSKRKDKIRHLVLEARQSPTAKPIIDEDLLSEVTGLVEWPVALVGNFDKSFLEVPQEALISAMQEHQKYFPIVDNNGKLLPLFITVSNLESKHPEKVIAGNEKVIRPRLADAKFFFTTDKKQSLEQRCEKLKTVVFQEKLGSLWDKSNRVAQLASHIAGLLGTDPDLAKRAGLLSKADLNTEMVGEFPDLQGIMGQYYAGIDGEAEEVCAALNEQYQPRFSGDEIPKTLTGCALALADRLDTLVGIFAIGQIPTGDKDPFALRRASLGIIRILIEKSFDIDLLELINASVDLYRGQLETENVQPQLLEFITSRYRAHYKDQGIQTPIIIAVENKKPTSPLDFHKRVLAVDEFNQLPEAAALSAANKRVKNILNKQDQRPINPAINKELLIEDGEIKLAELLQQKKTQVSPLFQNGEYSQALTALSEMRDSIDQFFDGVMVNVDDDALRNNRLALLANLHDLFSQVADISVLTQ